MTDLPTVTFLGFEIPQQVSFDLSRNFTAMVDQVVLTVPRTTDGLPRELADALTFHGGAETQAFIDGELVFTGYVTGSTSDGTGEGTVVELHASSKTYLLAKSQVTRGFTLKDLSIREVVSALADYTDPLDEELSLGIEVEVDALSLSEADVVIPTFKVNYGENPASAIVRALDYEGLLAYCSPKGTLVISRAGTTVGGQILKFPGNVLARTVTRDFSARSSHYYVVSGDRGVSVDEDADPALSLDPGVRQYSPTVIRAGADRKTQAARQKLADWTRGRNVASSFTYEANVIGARTTAGNFWEPNTLVGVQDPAQNVDHDLLVTRVSFMRDPENSATQLELVPPQCFDPLKTPRPRKSDGTRQPFRFPTIEGEAELREIDDALGGIEYAD